MPGDKTTGTCQWNLVDDFDVYEKGKSIEAPSLFRPIGSRTWKLAYQNYSGGGYRLVDLDEHCMNPQGMTNIQGNVQPQHGSFVKLTQKEYQHLETWEQVVTLLKQARKLQAVQPLQALNDAIEFGDQALATSGSFDEECERQQRAGYQISPSCCRTLISQRVPRDGAEPRLLRHRQVWLSTITRLSIFIRS